MRTGARAGAALAAAGAAGLAYALAEARSYRLRRRQVPVLPAGRPALRVLHVSDLHLTPHDRDRARWVRALAGLRPDLVVLTGDSLAHEHAVPVALDALAPLLECPGAFVLGSNDYFGPAPVRPWRYLMGPSDVSGSRRELPWKDLVQGMTDAGWLDLSNSRGAISLAGCLVDMRGVDDPHIGRDRYELVAGPFDDAADLALAVTHAPYLRVLDAMATDGAALMLAGHTHGGQLCIPGWGALVTNCDLPPALASGLSRHARPERPGQPGLGGVDGRGTFLHVSAGVGTSPYAPVRVACPPEATLLTLVARTTT